MSLCGQPDPYGRLFLTLLYSNLAPRSIIIIHSEKGTAAPGCPTIIHLGLFSIVTLLRFDHDLQDQLDHTEDLQDELSDV